MIEIIVTCLWMRAFLSKGETGKNSIKDLASILVVVLFIGSLLQVSNVGWDERAIDGEIGSATWDWR